MYIEPKGDSYFYVKNSNVACLIKFSTPAVPLAETRFRVSVVKLRATVSLSLLRGVLESTLAWLASFSEATGGFRKVWGRFLRFLARCGVDFWRSSGEDGPKMGARLRQDGPSWALDGHLEATWGAILVIFGFPGVSKLESSCQNTQEYGFLTSGDLFWIILWPDSRFSHRAQLTCAIYLATFIVQASGCAKGI